MYRENLLRGKIAENGYNVHTLAGVLGIHEVTLAGKLKKGRFTVPEVQQLIQVLKLSPRDVNAIFFDRLDT